MAGRRLKIDDFHVKENSGYRRQGIGTELLRLACAKADKAGVEVIWGEITKKDLAAASFLPALYAKVGFTISEPDAKCEVDATLKISRMRP